MNQFKSLFAVLLAFTLLFSSCNDEETTSIEPEPDTSDPLYENLSNLFGADEIVDHEDHYLVQNELVFYKDKDFDGLGHVLSDDQFEVSVFLDKASFQSIDVEKALTMSITSFNDLGSPVQFRLVSTPDQADIVVTNDASLQEGVSITSGLPFADGSPFDKISVSETQLLGTDEATLTALIARQLGHTIGMTNNSINDVPSAMNRKTQLSENGPFTISDAYILKSLYPAKNNKLGRITDRGTRLNPGDYLYRNQKLEYRYAGYYIFDLVFQGDGNCVAHHRFSGIVGSTYSGGSAADRLAMQSDGNLVLYDASGNYYWASNTGTPGSYFSLNTSGSWYRLGDGVVVGKGYLRWSIVNNNSIVRNIWIAEERNG